MHPPHPLTPTAIPEPPVPHPPTAARSLSRLLFIAAVAWNASTHAGETTSHLVPYRGVVHGAVVSDFALQNPTASAVVRSSPFGPGEQAFEELTLSLSADGPYTVLETGGHATTTTAGGRTLCIQFALRGIFTGPSSVTYTGTFTVVAEGTTLFAYPALGVPGLGEGTIVGTAEVQPDPLTGTITFVFHHRFEGTVRVGNR